MSDIELDYDYLTQKALKRVVYDVLTITAELGATPGEHHFYIEFLTTAGGVTIPDDLLETYPDRMTIVLQHQFEDLTIDDDGFGVTLWFKGKQARLIVPFDAVTSFADPSVQFGLRFSPDAEAASPPADAQPADAAIKPASEQNDGADVVSLDQFRKK